MPATFEACISWPGGNSPLSGPRTIYLKCASCLAAGRVCDLTGKKANNGYVGECLLAFLILS